uniref:Uncharacterized protein n=1 Tax=Romanomermis culicivorax TaxID=13658 RepID=A0A915KVG9_ROMCU
MALYFSIFVSISLTAKRPIVGVNEGHIFGSIVAKYLRANLTAPKRSPLRINSTNSWRRIFNSRALFIRRNFDLLSDDHSDHLDVSPLIKASEKFHEHESTSIRLPHREGLFFNKFVAAFSSSTTSDALRFKLVNFSNKLLTVPFISSTLTIGLLKICSNSLTTLPTLLNSRSIVFWAMRNFLFKYSYGTTNVECSNVFKSDILAIECKNHDVLYVIYEIDFKVQRQVRYQSID